VLLLAALLACRPPVCVPTVERPGDGIDQDCDGVDATDSATTPTEPRVLEGAAPDESFGLAVAWAGSRVVVGAPFAFENAGRLVVEGSPPVEGAPGDRFGRYVATLDDGTVLAAAPGAGELRTADGAVLLTGATGPLAARGDRWVAAVPGGAVWDDGTRIALPGTPSALLVLADGTLVAGFARGEPALRVGTTDLARPTSQDEAGFALAVADLDGNGAEELLVGAPGAGAVWVLDPAAPSWEDALTAEGGRFGAALAPGPRGSAYVGAPTQGPEVQGALWRVDGRAPTRLDVGPTPDAGRGAALAWSGTRLAVGSPGRADAPGSVEVVDP